MINSNDILEKVDMYIEMINIELEKDNVYNVPLMSSKMGKTNIITNGDIKNTYVLEYIIGEESLSDSYELTHSIRPSILLDDFIPQFILRNVSMLIEVNVTGTTSTMFPDSEKHMEFIEKYMERLHRITSD